ncbi:MAG: hypothetical protein CVV44_16120 [Spirochaetae bacterium HGW-Spirochaetae-1]|jgi:hypothetical protein|nr:MAG: hypothetical protein CVV44_16120 [Spirochaetae bacterium HGW-Spirochaetae-1]
MKSYLAEIKKSYIARYKNPAEQKIAWQRAAALYPPQIDIYDNLRPSLLLARHGGDMGLALLWIVQATLIQSLLRAVKEVPVQSPSILSIIGGDKKAALGALAHSEAGHEPVTIAEKCDSIVISGVKKYITAGMNADFILLTARHRGEEKISRLVFIPSPEISTGEMENLDLGYLDTTTHGRLILREKVLPPGLVIPMAPPVIRKNIKVWGVVERALIMEAYAAFALGLDQDMAILTGAAAGNRNEQAAVEEILTTMIGNNNELIAKALKGDRLEPDYSSFGAVLAFITKLKDRGAAVGDSMPEDMGLRFRDLDFVLSMAGKK